jgi:hypothetical protein
MLTQKRIKKLGRKFVVTTFYESNPQQKRQELYFDERGLLHREPDEGPAKVHWREDGNFAEVSYFWHGLRHREGGPALVYFAEKKDVPWQERWYRYGRLHRDQREGPAAIDWNGPNYLVGKFYYIHGYPFRDPRDGPEVADFNGREDWCTSEVFSDEIPPRPRPPISWLRHKFGQYHQDLGPC